MKGLYSVLITPFTQSDELDEEGFRNNIRFQLKNKVDGIVVLGTTGEAPTLNEHEKKKIVQIAREEMKDKEPLMVGTGSYSTKIAIEQTQKAKDLGADIALVVTPYYNKPTQEGLYRHFKALTEAVNIPICVYNIQGRTGQNIQTNTLLRIADLPNIIGVKEASGNINQMAEVIESIARHRPDFKVMSGDDALTLPLIAIGGHGILSVVSNLLPKAVKALTNAALLGDMKLAQALHYQLLPIFRIAFIETNPIPIKTMMSLCGMAAGTCRLPLCEISNENLTKLKQVIENQVIE